VPRAVVALFALAAFFDHRAYRLPRLGHVREFAQHALSLSDCSILLHVALSWKPLNYSHLCGYSYFPEATLQIDHV